MTYKHTNRPVLDEFVLSIVLLPKFSAPEYISEFSLSEQEWDKFLILASQEGLSSLVYYNLTNHKHAFKIPPVVLSRLKQEFYINTGRNVCIRDELDNIYSAFENKKIDAVLVRGAVFFDKIYPALGIRPLVDADIVIFEKDLEAVSSMLRDIGYQSSNNYPFFLEKDNFYLDLHLNVPGYWRARVQNSSIDISDSSIWQETIPLKENYFHVRGLGLYDSILASAQHLQWHDFSRLIWFVDIANLINSSSQDLDYDYLIKRAETFNLKKTLYFMIKYLNQYRLIATEERFLKDLDKLPLNRFEKKTSFLLLANKRENISGEMLFLFSLGGLKSKLKFIIDVIFLDRQRLPLEEDKKGSWVYLKRFYRLFSRTFLRFMKVFCQ
ncbi:MAG: nucleotidyltransferase family protein [Candidatus Omnitrophica bacterium]|nr:nucleotidyltransferase family protein [Candidatus Omnitrophota bacterium]